MPHAAANGQAATAGRGRAVAPTTVAPDDEGARPSGSAVYRSVYASVEEAPAAAARTLYPRSAAEALWADLATPAPDDQGGPAGSWTSPSVRGRVTVPSQAPSATGPEPTSPPQPLEPTRPPAPPPPMPSPDPFEPAPPTPQPPMPQPPSPQPPTPQPPAPPQPPFPQPPPPPQPPAPPPQPPVPPFPPPPPTADFTSEDLDRPMPVVTAAPAAAAVSVSAQIPSQAAPVSGGGYANDDWRSHFSAAPTSPAPAQRGTVYGSRPASDDAAEPAESAVAAS